MSYLTPTQWAEEAYQAKLKQNRPMAVGPSGLAIPSERSIYRPTQDGRALVQLLKAAGSVAKRTAIPEGDVARFRLQIADELKRLWPTTDMLVLERYGFAIPIDSALVLINSDNVGAKPIHVDLPGAILMPKDGFRLECDLGGRWSNKVPKIPAECVEHCKAVVAARETKRLLEVEGTRFPGQFKVRTGRWPRWIEIEREFPPLAAFLATERASIPKSKGHRQ